MIDSPRDRDPVELLAEEYASRWRKGESPSVSEYAGKYPQFAEQIEELFPAVEMMERLRTADMANREAASRENGSADVPEQIGDFRIVREVGRGGMGIVYEAEQRSLGRRVAVKVLPKHALLLDRHLKRFQREAQTTANLHHTNIVPVFGTGEQDGLYYYVMPLVRGVGLDEVIRRLRSVADSSEGETKGTNRLDASSGEIDGLVRGLIAEKYAATGPVACEPEGDAPNEREAGRAAGSPGLEHWRTVARVGAQAAEALAYAHAQGMLHRDVKPSNLLVDETGMVLVADFGLARAVDESDASRTGEVVGTLRYMAPEQFSGAADARSDVYSLGLTLYELLTLRPALDGADRRRALHGRPVDAEPVRPRKVNRAVPRDLETIVMKCLAGEPAGRYQTASALGMDLRRFLEGRPIRARRVSLVERAWRWCRRDPALAAMSAVAAALLVAVGITALVGHLRTRSAFSEAQQALVRSESTSRLALDVLDDIYLQLSPDRIWILSDADGGGEACVCLGLRSSVGSGSSTERAAMQLHASKETASLLEGLLVFYDRLAEQAGDDSQVMLQAAVASRRVGDIRQLLGQLDEAEQAYVRAVEKLSALSARANARAELTAELARTYNELGNVQSARFEPGPAYESHRKAISILRSAEATDAVAAQHRYELARTLYLLANKQTIEPRDRRGDGSGEEPAAPGPRRYDSRECRKLAIGILEALIGEDPNIPDYRFLLALCHRPSGGGPDPVKSAASRRGWEQAIGILKELKTQYPDVTDYRYELTATYAWVYVGLFPWQRPSRGASDAEASLLEALEESEWLVAHNPSVPHYARSKALILAKLATVCWRTQRTAEAGDLFQRALETQRGMIAEFPDLSAHDRVVLEFVRLRLAQVCYDRGGGSGASATAACRDLLDTCIENLTELIARPELTEDRLGWTSLEAAYDVLGHVLDEAGEGEKAEEAKQRAERMRVRIPSGRGNPWQP